jgi:hypothetical protein
VGASTSQNPLAFMAYYRDSFALLYVFLFEGEGEVKNNN